MTGVPGYSAFKYFHSKYPDHVTAIRPVRYWPLREKGIVPLDIEDRKGLATLMKQKRFKSVLNGAGSCALKSCEMNPVLAYRVNVQSALNIVEVFGGHDIRLIHLFHRPGISREIRGTLYRRGCGVARHDVW